MLRITLSLLNLSSIADLPPRLAARPSLLQRLSKENLFQLLGGEEALGIRLTESFAMHPAASVCGFYFSHPEARYFTVGRIDRDQVEDYAARTGLSLEDAERWLAPNLGYDPDA